MRVAPDLLKSANVFALIEGEMSGAAKCTWLPYTLTLYCIESDFQPQMNNPK